MATVKRKAKGVRRSAAAKGRANTARKARAHTSSVMDSAMAILPFTEEQLHRVFLAIIIGGAVALAWFVASLAGVPAMAQQQIAGFASKAGFEVRHVSVTGVERMNELKIYNRVLGEQDQPMPLVDLEAIRADLLELNWVKDARVSRQLPDRLVIDIVERTPHAVLAKADRLVLIDPTGEELEPISQANAKGMLIVTGPGAKKQVTALTDLLDAAPALKPQIGKAEWIGNRRWNLTFATDQVLALPQGEKEASSALVAFARLDGKSRLIGGKVATFDMRAPERIYMRIPGRSDQTLDMNGGS
ncbi:FtsQ-type POTRA domain-containing protein [Pontixanthobacter aestiaquae]|uniref:Cell division protein FtsQ n=1 Tax=Pontixanthobacter aestiaquae TaxID=1509367 RepID=A0A844Z7V2_9SPHN|nr:FtsQ-type POTRA domain-containing protein [Pontixanthobacter aestiaquae]MDN3646014.1 FtsQ-type POTRA domain-containing protein [Pontixanthobacter aestiaquae]MXO82993.1 FtsQ-type POTRA domain-containing protein [Pontixanthobacter aestiaquae]